MVQLTIFIGDNMSYNKMGILANDVEFSLYNDRYLNHHHSILISKESKIPIKAYTVDINMRNSNILSTMGELFEREILINKNQNKKDEILGFSLIDGSIKSKPKREIIYVDKFVDSCGMASHTNSFELIKKALFEFFERQCLILSYLSKYPGFKIGEDILQNEEINRYRKYLNNFIDEVKFYNISLSTQLNVVLGIGIGHKNKCIGLGTSENLLEAIKKSMQEMLQYFFGSCSKNSSISNSNLLMEYEESNRDLYHAYFDSITSQELNEEYEYLEKGAVANNIVQLNRFDIKKFIDDINTMQRMEPYAFFFPNQRNLSNLKILKIYDFNWFPNLLPLTYSEELYIKIENLVGRKLIRGCKYIPFP